MIRMQFGWSVIMARWRTEYIHSQFSLSLGVVFTSLWRRRWRECRWRKSLLVYRSVLSAKLKWWTSRLALLPSISSRNLNRKQSLTWTRRQRQGNNILSHQCNKITIRRDHRTCREECCGILIRSTYNIIQAEKIQMRWMGRQMDANLATTHSQGG